jgi:hypothetical protein
MVYDFELKVEHFNFAALTEMDAHIAATVAAQGCPFCQGPLHVANYQRKPRGGRLAAIGEQYPLRYSLCCGRRGCRKRVLPASLRFLGRRVYLEVVVILSCLSAPTSKALRMAARLYGISKRTLVRWRHWWREEVARTKWWLELRSRLTAPGPESAHLPASLLTYLHKIVSGTKLATLVTQCLAPATTWVTDAARFVGEVFGMGEQR